MDEFEKLRQLLLQPEEQRLVQLEQRLDDPKQRSRETAAVLSHALQQVGAQPQLAKALQQPVDTCLEQSVHSDPQRFAKPLLAVMTPSVRKTIAASLKSIREFLNAQQQQLNQLESRLDTLQTAALPELEQRLSGQLQEQEQRLQELASFVNDTERRGRELAEMLPVAIREASLQNQPPTLPEQKAEELVESLRQPVERCLQESISENTHTLANALFPVMGPAIRKSINESIKGLVQQINTTLERSISARGIAWRIQAWRSGRSFAEVVIQNTLAYRVEQVFLIHRESGLLLQHEHQQDVTVQDSDAVSAMFTAIQDFTRDSFSSDKTEELDSVEIGEFTVWLERGPYAVLACVIRGAAPYGFRQAMSQQLEALHARYTRLLKTFEGDPEPLEPARPLLHRLLRSEVKAEEKKRRQRLISPGLLLLLLLSFGSVAAWGWWQWQAYLRAQQFQAYVDTLNATPGLVVVESRIQGGQLHLQGLRDPLAADPQQLLDKTELDAETVLQSWRAYQDMAPEFAQRRLQQRIAAWLQAPDSAQLDWQGGRLKVSGHASRAWIERLQDTPRLFPELDALDHSELRDDQAQFDTLLEQLGQTPGLVVVSSGVEQGRRHLSGLRDPLAADPQALAEQLGFAPGDVAMEWQPYQALLPEFIERRARLALQPPETVDMRLDEGVLVLQGHAPQAWLQRLEHWTLAGVSRLNTEQLQSTEALLLEQARSTLQAPQTVTLSLQDGTLLLSGAVAYQERQRIRAALPQLQGFTAIDERLRDKDLALRQRLLQTVAKTFIMFPEDSLITAPQQAKLQQVATTLNALAKTLPAQGKLRIVLTGDTDGVGSLAYNKRLSQERSQAVKTQLERLGVPAAYLQTRLPENIRFGERESDTSLRRVGFEVQCVPAALCQESPEN